MKPPPLLLGVALLFWGWQSDLLPVGALLAVVLESSRVIHRRWDFSPEDLARIWSALTRPYRLSIAYEVRMAVIDSSVERTVRRVIEREERYVRVP